MFLKGDFLEEPLAFYLKGVLPPSDDKTDSFKGQSTFYHMELNENDVDHWSGITNWAPSNDKMMILGATEILLGEIEWKWCWRALEIELQIGPAATRHPPASLYYLYQY